MADQITVTLDGPGSIRVEWGDRYVTHLTRDEALYTVAAILTGAVLPGWMQTKAEHDAADAERAARLKRIAEEGVDPDFEVKGGAP
jgi:hypothetical protein